MDDDEQKKCRDLDDVRMSILAALDFLGNKPIAKNYLSYARLKLNKMLEEYDDIVEKELKEEAHEGNI